MRRAVLFAWILAASAYGAQTVEGRVVSAISGTGISGARVTILRGERAEYSTETDSDGDFRILGVADGAYTVNYRARGFREFPGLTDGPGQATIQITAGAAVRLAVKLQPLPKFSGRVLDDAGKPVANARVFLLGNTRGCSEPKCFDLLKESKSGEDGAYTIGDVDALGPWVISAFRAGSVQTFYPNAAEAQLAAKLQLPSGGELSNLDIKLAVAPVHTVRGKVVDAAPNATVTLYNGFGASFEQATAADGAFEFPQVAAGAWRIAATMKHDSVVLWGAQTLHVQDRDLERIELWIAPPFALRGKIVFDAPQGAAVPADDLPNVIAGQTAGEFGGDKTCPARPIGHADEKGNFTIPVCAGPHRIDILEPPPAQYYLDSVRLGDRDALGPEVAIQSADQALTVTYKFGGGTVQGTVDGCGAGGRVLLLPQDPALRRHEFLRESPCGANGGFEFTAVRPGEYYGFAVSADSSASWYTALLDGTLVTHGSKVTVTAGAHTAADIRLTRW